MLMYTSTFPLSSEVGPEQVVGMSARWLSDSPHHNWTRTDLPDSPESDHLHVLRKYDQVVEYGVLRGQDGSLAAFRHRWTENATLEWTTEVTTSFVNERQPLFCVRVQCSSVVAGVALPMPRKPYLVRRAMEELGGGSDGAFAVSDVPVELREGDLEIARSVVDGDSGTLLPIVYVSSSYGTEAYADASALARHLSGLAHVVVEPSRQFSFDLREATAGRNTYGGAVGVYWPRGTGLHARYLPSSFRYDELERVIIEDIRLITCESQPIPGTTWSAVDKAESDARLRSLRAERSTDIDEWVEAFESDRQSLVSDLERANNEIDKLRGRLRSRERAGSAGGALLGLGNEADLFPGEVLEIVIAAMAHARSRAGDDTRTAHVIDDLIEANPIASRRDGMVAEVKSIVSDAERFTNREIERLEDLGFTVSSSGKHHKAVYGNDARYQFSIAKTSSDHRAGKNLASEICSKLFK